MPFNVLEALYMYTKYRLIQETSSRSSSHHQVLIFIKYNYFNFLSLISLFFTISIITLKKY